MDFSDPRQVVSDSAAAEALGVSISRIKLAKKRGEIPVLRLGKTLLIPKHQFIQFIDLKIALAHVDEAPQPSRQDVVATLV